MLNAASIPTPLVETRDTVFIAQSAPPRRLAALVISLRLLRLAGTIAWFRLIGRSDPGADGRRLRFLLEDLGGLWIKLGQLLSLRVDLFPLAFCRELSQLQIKVVGFPGVEAIAILEADLGRPVDAVFETFDETPLAAASMGQVHVARLRGSGVRVAVKVQRPHLPDVFEHQRRVIRAVLWIIAAVGFRPNLRWEELLWELTQIMHEEMDCRYEASLTRRMRRTLKAHGIYAPRVFYATKRVLVTEFIDGVLMADYIRVRNSDPERLAAWLTENGIAPHLVGEQLILSLLRQILEDNLFHGDLHPGNVMLLRDNKIALIDFGACSFTEREYLARFHLTVRSLASRDYLKAADCTLLLCGTLPPVDLDRIRDEFVRAMHLWAAKTSVPEVPYHQKSVAVIYNEVIRILYEHDATMEWALLRIRRAQETLDASLLYLIPEVNYRKIAVRYFRAADRRAAAATRRDRARMQDASTIDTTLDAIATVDELTLLGAGNIRRRVQRFEASANRAAALIAAFVARVAVLAGLTTALVFAAFAVQRLPRLAAWLLGAAIVEHLQRVPHLDAQLWTLALTGSVLWTFAVLRLKHRLRAA
jgi:ubiquinone biosynthesis protein